ncbi:MAG TPA: FAD-binding oxidoreductase [Ilumatobacter sp.]|nr:FAD-binding oxidoreductase [Ilumatobacter sp.]
MAGCELAGWGNNGASWGELVIAGERGLPAAILGAGERGVIMRGLGRSYGDPAQNSGGRTVRLQSDPASITIDSMIDSVNDTNEQATVTCGAGVSVDELLNVIVPQGYFVPVTAGTRFITIGGAIASDIHGKNHHQDGSFGNHVRDIELMLADGSIVHVGPDEQPGNDHELFWATVGGMGLTGAMVAATFSVIPIESSLMSVETRRIDDLDELMARMAASDDDVRYSVAWIDLLAKGSKLGRGVLTNGEHAGADQLTSKHASRPLAYSEKVLATLPPLVPSPGVINRLSVAAFNEMWFRKAPRERHDELQTIAAYFHPLDMVGRWNRVYGRHGLLQYQFVVPYGAEDTLRRVMERINSAALPSFLTVLKRFGPGNAAPLSFPTAGWTLAIDVPAAHPQLPAVLVQLDSMVLEAGGRHYLAKDFHTNPEAIRRGYPRLAEWQAVQRRVDPFHRWASDQSRRLELVGSNPNAQLENR